MSKHTAVATMQLLICEGGSSDQDARKQNVYLSTESGGSMCIDHVSLCPSDRS